MLLRLQPYDVNVSYKPGKEIPMGDALSHAHEIAEQLRSDNGTQFASRGFALFCKDYQIDHYTSSPFHSLTM